ncbi:MAG TPA: Stp1/IreP family PP2C-type Ser/Thr phosphatase [Mycobacteriales bacterium]|nr:Stp1/IreP family PP2C-type Ser/Thr phosphatase [Mycobacteriales bacterium]
MSLSLRYAARSDVGLLREGNEDSMYAGPRLLAVADGMGGHAAGEVASRVVIETIAGLDTQPPGGDQQAALQQAVQTANGYLRDMVAADAALEGMGTTLTALLWVDQQLTLAHIGDSRAYLFRDGALQLLTHDHTLVQNLIDEGRISPDEASTHPQRSWITRALDGRSEVDLDLSDRDPRAGDRYLICSDGLSSYVSEDTMAEALAAPDPQLACDQLVELALRAGGPDNITCIVADLTEAGDPDEQPIVGGAAADDAVGTRAPDSPAARAAAIGGRAEPASTAAAPATPPPAGDVDDHAPAPTDNESSGGSRRVALVLGAAVLVVLLGVLGTFLYIRTQYYVGVADGAPATVGVYRGVTGSVLGIDLSRLADRSNLPVQALPDYERPRVSAGIPAASHDDARRIVAKLRQEACPSPAPSPRPTATRTSATFRHHARHRRAVPSPRPSPSPTPRPYCTASP